MMQDRLDPEYLKQWRKQYEGVCAAYLRGEITLLETIDCLRHLHFKDDALKAEWISLEREKNKPSNAHKIAADIFLVSEKRPQPPTEFLRT